HARRGLAVLVGIAAEETGEELLAGVALGRIDLERDRRRGVEMRGDAGEAQSRVVAAELVYEAARLGVLARPHAAARDLLDAVLVEPPAGGDAVLEAGIDGVEEALEMALALRRVVLDRAEHPGIAALLHGAPGDAELVPQP